MFRFDSLFVIALGLFVLVLTLFPLRALGQEAPSKEELIKQLENYYVEMYSEPLRAKGRFPKLLAIMSLSKIQADRTSAAVLELMSNRDPVVRYLAWEVLHSRQTSLSPEQRLSWAKSAAEMSAAGDFPGRTLAAPLRVLAAFPPEEFAKERIKIISRVIEEYSPSNQTDVPVLDAARVLMGAWRDDAMVTRVKSKVDDGANAAWYVMQPLAKTAATDGPLETAAQRRAAIEAWQRSPESKYDPAKLVPYDSLGKLIPPGKVITDPNSDEFRAELEIGKLNVDAIDVMWVIDATGSMYGPNQVIAGQTAHFAAALGVLSDRVRFGATYYRHELDPRLQTKCCAPAARSPYYQVKVHPLTGNIVDIVRVIASEPIPKPDAKLRNMHPGCAVAGGIQGAVGGAKWIDDDEGKRVLILVGDAFLTPGSESAVAALVKQATDHDYLIHSLLLGAAIKEWPPHIKGSNIEPIKLQKLSAGGDNTEASPAAVDAFRALERSVILSTVSENFHNRIDPLLKAMTPYIDSVAGG